MRTVGERQAVDIIDRNYVFTLLVVLNDLTGVGVIKVDYPRGEYYSNIPPRTIPHAFHFTH